MKVAHHLSDIFAVTKSAPLSVLYISRPNCSVCHGLLPQIEKVLEEYPLVDSIHANAEEIPEIAGEFSIFTVPVVIVFNEGKELFRKARFVPIEEFNYQLNKLVHLLFD